MRTAVAVARLAKEDDVHTPECATNAREVGVTAVIGERDGVRANPRNTIRLRVGSANEHADRSNRTCKTSEHRENVASPLVACLNGAASRCASRPLDPRETHGVLAPHTPRPRPR